MTNEERALDTKERIKEEIAFYGEDLPESVNLVWQGYITALSEWGLIERKGFSELFDLLPPINSNPAYSVSTGVPGDHLRSNKM